MEEFKLNVWRKFEQMLDGCEKTGETEYAEVSLVEKWK